MHYKHSIATVSLSGTLPQKLRAIARAGYDGVELFENDLLVSHLSPAEVGRLAADLGLEVVTLQPFREFEGMPAAQRIKNFDRAERKFDIMEQLGTRMLFVCSNVSPLTQNDINRAANDLADLAERAALRGFLVGYEALSWGRYVADYRQAAEIVRRGNRPNLKNILDSFHVAVVGSDLTELRSLPGDSIALVQLADAPRYDMGAMHLSRHYRCFPGQGSMPVVPFMEALMATGYRGYISHEVFSDEFRGLQLDQTALDGKRSLVWIERAATPAGSPVVLDDLNFIEFATPATEEQPLVHLLENLGFAETHRHRTKDVRLYRAGGINLVLNRRANAHAATYADTHGAGVCAVGFLSQHPDAAIRWADELQYAGIDNRERTGELPIPAVRGFGDVLYYFVGGNHPADRLYATEFEPTGAISAQNGLTRIDHIGHTVSADLYQSNTLFHRAMLGLEAEDSLDLFDPYGIVYSRVLKSRDGRIRISLNARQRPIVPNQEIASDQFTTAPAGEGIQQLALATTDIFQTAKGIRDPAIVLPIPANYYDDLRSKSVLPADDISRMQQYNILFDQQGDAHFYHFYLRELNGLSRPGLSWPGLSWPGLFIEVVQRRPGYDRYGEVNAQVRLTAQARERLKDERVTDATHRLR